MIEEKFDEIFDKIANKHNVPSGHIYSRESLKKLCLQFLYEMRAIEEKDAEEMMKKMGFTLDEIKVLKQEDNCKVCPDPCDSFAKSTDVSQHKRQKFLAEHPEGCRSKWDLHHVGEGLGDWEGIVHIKPLPLFGNNIRELILAFKLAFGKK